MAAVRLFGLLFWGGSIAAMVHAVGMPAQAQGTERAKADASGVAMRLSVPAYFYPSGPGLREWERLMEASRSVPIVAIVNPASGPGERPDASYAAVLPRARAAGITLVGYVHTQYGSRPIGEVEDEAARFLRFYPDLRGIHFDQQSSNAQGVEYYAEVHRYVHRRIAGALVLTNPGTVCDVGYVARPASDVITLFEDARGLEVFRPPAWIARFPGSRFGVQAHEVMTAEAMTRAVRRAAELGIGYVFFTDDVGPNPYDRLPTYWDAEVAAVRQVNRAAATPR